MSAPTANTASASGSRDASAATGESQSSSAHGGSRVGAPEDVGYCAEEDVSELVPVLSFRTGIPAIVVRKETKG